MRVYFEVNAAPYAAGRSSFIGELLTRLELNNIIPESLGPFPKINPEFVETGITDALVQIGDRTFLNRNQYPYQYDLALEWYKFTGLPFVFAVWASNKIISEDFKTAFNTALEYGLNHRMEMIADLEEVKNIDLEDYLMKKIDFNLDTDKLAALAKFTDLIKTL